MKVGAVALLAALLFLVAVVIQADDDRALVPPPRPIELGSASDGAPVGSSPRGSPGPSPEPTWVEHDVEYEDLEDWEDDNSGPGAVDSGKGSDDSGGDDNSGKGSDDSGGDDD